MQTQFRFAYKWINSPEMEDLARKLVRADADRFFEWYARKVHKNALDRDFRVWWRIQGPTGFTNYEDTRQYCSEVWQLVRNDATDKADSGGVVDTDTP
jgi:macrodomain Ter protein organizer (MatP/YcbG family)